MGSTTSGLNLKFVSVGAEPAQVARWTQLYKQGKPVLFYWYDPQYLNAKYKVDLIKLPARFKGCKDDEKAGGNPKARVRLPELHAAQVRQQEVRDERLARRLIDQALEVVEHRPERSRQDDRRRPVEP